MPLNFDRRGYPEDDGRDALMAALAGRTITSAVLTTEEDSPEGARDRLVLDFTDGSRLTLVTWDAESYASGLHAEAR